MAVANAAKTVTPSSGPHLYVAAVTPCDNRGKFDDAIYRDMMPFFKDRGVDGVLVLGTTGEFASFSVAERKKVAETALKHRSGLEMMVQVGTPNLPETLDLLAYAILVDLHIAAGEVLHQPALFIADHQIQRNLVDRGMDYRPGLSSPWARRKILRAKLAGEHKQRG